jgi:hypothetical protein
VAENWSFISLWLWRNSSGTLSASGHKPDLQLPDPFLKRAIEHVFLIGV